MIVFIIFVLCFSLSFWVVKVFILETQFKPPFLVFPLPSIYSLKQMCYHIWTFWRWFWGCTNPRSNSFLMPCNFEDYKIYAWPFILLLTMVSFQRSLRDRTRKCHIFIFCMVGYPSHYIMCHVCYIFRSGEDY